MPVVSSLVLHSQLWHPQNINRPSEAWCWCMKIVCLFIIFGACHVRDWIMHALSWWTVNVFSHRLFWLFISQVAKQRGSQWSICDYNWLTCFYQYPWGLYKIGHLSVTHLKLKSYENSLIHKIGIRTTIVLKFCTAQQHHCHALCKIFNYWATVN